MLTTLLIALLLYTSLVIVFYARQSRLIFAKDPLDGAWQETPRNRGLVYQDLWLETQDQLRIHAWYLPNKTGHAGTVLYLHGNNTNLSHQIDHLATLHQSGLNVLAIDYRGYGKSQHHPATEHGLYSDAEAAWTYLQQQKGVQPQQLIIHGRSLGGGVASYLAKRVQPAGLILESTYTSIPNVGREKYPWLPVPWLSRSVFPTLERLASIRCPVCVIHSPDDRVIGFSHAQRLFKASEPRSAFVVIRGAHSDGFLQSLAIYQAGLLAFIDQQGLSNPSARPTHKPPTLRR